MTRSLLLLVSGLIALPAWGTYAVGFRSLYQLDTARSWDSDYPVDGKPAGKKPRPIFIAVWYPAGPNTSAAMVYQDYFKAVSVDSPVPDFAKRLRKFTRDSVCEYMIGKDFDELSKEQRAYWNKFLASPTLARLNAPPAAGKFPVVLYHPGLGGTFEDDSVLFENLASHGYVVISSAYQAADSTSLNIDGDLSTSQADLTFLSRFAATLPFADTSKLAAMGHSYGAQAVLAWRAEPGSPVDAVISMDSTVDYLGLDSDRPEKLRAMMSRNRKSPVPVLFFADRLRHPKFDTFDPYMSFAPRYEATVDDQEHNDFVSQGMLGEALRAPQKAAAARVNYERVGERVLQFLDASLNGKTLPAEPEMTFKAPQPLPPTGRQLAHMLERNGADATRRFLAGFKTIDADVFTSAIAALADSGPEKDILEIIVLGAEKNPDWPLLKQLEPKQKKQVDDRLRALQR